MPHFPARDGLELSYRELGEGRPLVLLHGFTGDSRQWLDHGPAAALAERGHRVVLPDLRGHGDSPAPDDPAAYPPDVLVDDGLALIAHLGLDGYDLGGYSLGGRVALRMLVRGARPARAIVGAQGLTAVCQSPQGDSSRRLLTDLAEGRPAGEEARWITGDPRALLRVLDSLVPTSAAELSHLTTPILLVAGDEDARDADALAAALPAARLVRVPGNHFTALGNPGFATAVAGFLAEPLT
ncbi:alpha/beta fold hydrolase [Amycolatopsis sp. NEAU-NG30]|uniref:Alpha/beta fold hydrolase n=1 Tax=Amycolatopsis melonis TaxID=3156488 RepID=A0ABV0LHI1_9PSEU